ncbi:hypothetical protein D3C81_2237710 [compost metagenome]
MKITPNFPAPDSADVGIFVIFIPVSVMLFLKIFQRRKYPAYILKPLCHNLMKTTRPMTVLFSEFRMNKRDRRGAGVRF